MGPRERAGEIDAEHAERGDQRGEWVYNHDFYIILNIAVGGTFVGPVGAGTTFPQELVVDYVRVLQRNP